MGWTNSHLYMFEAATRHMGLSRTTILAARICPSRKPLWAMASRTSAQKTISYIYDFAPPPCREHRIKIGSRTPIGVPGDSADRPD